MTASVGRYELLRRLGRGGMAEVFLARRRGPGGVHKRLAVKRIRRERARDPRFLDLFVEEARLSMALAHRNIVPTFDFGRIGDELFLVMEYVDGADLGAAMAAGLAAGQPIEPDCAAYVALEACQALDFAHRGRESGERPVIHRDVTPRNVLLSYAGEVKLVDFGVATSEIEIAGGTVRGTPGYMAPEQARGELVDPRSDIFALGLVLWEALAGRPTYTGSTASELLTQARTGAVPPLPEGVPAGLRAIVERATAADPASRYPDARAMQLALDDHVMTSRRPGSPPPSVVLADWLSAVYPREAPRDSAKLEVPEGAVVTFLEDGEEEIRHGRATQLSIAETLAEEPVSSPPPSAAPSTPSSSRSPSPSSPSPALRRPILAAALLLALAVLVTVSLLWIGRAGDADTSTTGPIAAASPDAAPVAAPQTPSLPDAGVPVPDAAPAIAASPDAGVRVVRGGKRRNGITAKQDAGPAEPPGTVRVNSEPWAVVEVVGRSQRCGETPCSLVLPPGTYTLKLHNPVQRVAATRAVTVVSGKTVDVPVTLTAPMNP